MLSFYVSVSKQASYSYRYTHMLLYGFVYILLTYVCHADAVLLRGGAFYLLLFFMFEHRASQTLLLCFVVSFCLADVLVYHVYA